MKIDLGHGATLQPDEEPRGSRFHRKIIETTRIAGTRSGHRLKLECGHVVRAFGNLAHAGGSVLCTECRDTKPSYEVGQHLENVPYIHCLLCRRTSFKPSDIERKYCGYCHHFHEDTHAT